MELRNYIKGSKNDNVNVSGISFGKRDAAKDNEYGCLYIQLPNDQNIIYIDITAKELLKMIAITYGWLPGETFYKE